MTALLDLLLNKYFDMVLVGVILVAVISHKVETHCEAQQVAQTAQIVSTIQEKKNEVTVHDAGTDALVKRLRRGTF